MTPERLRRNALYVAAAALFAVGACNSSPSGPAVNAPFSQTDVVVGTGATAGAGQTITVNYTGWLFDPSKPESKGLEFDTSTGKTPLTFKLGNGDVIVGWDQGLPGMKVGGTRRLVIPPSLAYGGARQGPIPANAGLVFDVVLVEIVPPASSGS